MKEATATIRPAADDDDMEVMRRLFRAYSDWLQVDLCFQGFNAEVNGLPGVYVPPRGGLWVAEIEGKAVGCVAFRPLEQDPDCAELKRLWVAAEGRGQGLGRRFAELAITKATEAGYRRMMLDTMPKMTHAIALYRELGFHEIPRPKWQPVPLVYMARDLA